MSLEYRFKLNGSVMANGPDNWEAFELKLRYSDEVRGVIREYNNNVVISGPDYDIIEDLFENNSLDTKIPFSIEYSANYGAYQVLIDAFIVISQSIIDPNRRVAECKIEDKGFVSSLYQNRTLPIPLNSSTTINGESITPVTEIQIDYDIDEESLIDAVEYGQALTYIINYLTDNGVSLSDAWYSSLQDYGGVSPQYYGISYSSSTPTPTLQDLFTTIAKLYNLYFVIVQSGSTLTFTVKTESQLYSTTTGATITAPETLKIRLIPERVYTSVSVGDSATQLSSVKVDVDYAELGEVIDVNASYVFDGLYGFVPTTYPIETLLGGGVDLNLQTPYGYSLGHYPTAQAKGKYVLCQYTNDVGTSTGRKIIMQDLDYTSTEYASFQNPPNSSFDPYAKIEVLEVDQGPASLQNTEVIDRYNFLGTIKWPREAQTQKVIQPRLSSSTAYNETNVSFDTYINIPLELTRETDAYNLQWSNLDHYFTATDVLDGYSLYQIDYRFNADWTRDGASDTFLIKTVVLIEVNGTTYQATVSSDSTSGFTSGSLTNSGSITVQVPSNGTKISLAFALYDSSGPGTYDFTLSFIHNGATPTYMDITRLHTTSETLATASSSTVKMYGVEIDTPMAVTDFITIFNDPTKRISISNLGNTHRGWVWDMSYKLAEGRVVGELITDHNNLYVV